MNLPLRERLLKAASLVGDESDFTAFGVSESCENKVVVADVGCDHAYLSIYLIKEGICDLAIASAYIALLSEKIYFLNRKIVAFTAKRADAALAGFLLDRLADGETMTVNMSRLASVLDIGRTTLYRAVDMLTEEGAIAYDGKEMKILSRELLEKRFNQ